MENFQQIQLNNIIEQINELDEYSLMNLNNAYCDINKYYDNQIYENNEEFFNDYFQNKPYEVAQSCFYGDYNFSHDFVKFNGYGNLQSIADYNLKENLVVSIETIANDIIGKYWLYNNDCCFDFQLLEEEEEEQMEVIE